MYRQWRLRQIPLSRKKPRGIRISLQLHMDVPGSICLAVGRSAFTHSKSWSM